MVSLFFIRVILSQHQRGAANGISMTWMSLFKAFGPYGGGALFSWGQSRKNASFLPDELGVVEALPSA
ncbi:hypothetical protein C5167_041399 [Papaver somniferum]|nr:hypothetical protein C5167_041399 [Papaver somniferum]